MATNQILAEWALRYGALRYYPRGLGIFFKSGDFHPGDWVFLKIWGFYPGDWGFLKIWGLGIFKIWGFQSPGIRDFWKSGDFYPRYFREIPGIIAKFIGDFLRGIFRGGGFFFRWMGYPTKKPLGMGVT